MYRTDNPIADFERWDADQQERLEKLPVCTVCGKRIQDDYCYEINDEIFCTDCLDDEFRRETEDYVL